MSEIFRSEFQNLKKISKKNVFFENLENTFRDSLKNTDLCGYKYFSKSCIALV